MFKWNNRNVVKDNKKITFQQKSVGFLFGLNLIYQQIVKTNFQYITRLQKHLNNFQLSSHNKFIDHIDEDKVCIICLAPLLGPCTTLACDCKLTLHEGCMFRLILGEFDSCPQCKLQLSLEKYKAKIIYPTTLKSETIQKCFNEILLDENLEKNVNVDKLLVKIKNDYVKDLKELNRIYV